MSYADENNGEPIPQPEHSNIAHIDRSYKYPHNFTNLKNAIEPLPHLYALHINGIGTTREEAYKNLENLKMVSNLQSGRNYLIWDVVYNPTAKVTYTDKGVESNRMFFTNVYDVIHQKNNELSLNNMMTLDNYVHGLLNGQSYDTDVYELLKEYATPDYASLIKQYSGKNIDTVIDNFHQKVPVQFAGVLNRISKEYGATMNYKKEPIAILLLPHSQGNLYANELYQYLTKVENVAENHIAIFGVASPAEKNLGDWASFPDIEDAKTLRAKLPQLPVGYVTSCSDGVINLLRVGETIRSILLPFNVILPGSVQIPTIAACNANGKSDGGDKLHHSLVDYYLNDANSKLRDRIVQNINYFSYVLDYSLMKDLNYNMVPYDSRYNQYPQTLAFIIGDAKVNDTQILENGSRIIWSYDYDLQKNPSGFIYLEEPLLDKYTSPLMHFVAAPHYRVVSDGYNPGKQFHIYEDRNYGKYKSSAFHPFYIYPYNENNPEHDNNPYNWNLTFAMDAYPWNFNSQRWPWSEGADGTCVFAGWSTNYVPKDRSFGNHARRYGIELLQNNPRLSDLNKCLAMPPQKYTNDYILDGWWNNQLLP